MFLWQVVAEMAAIGFGLPKDAFTSLMNLVRLFFCVAFLFTMHIAYFTVIFYDLPFVVHYLMHNAPLIQENKPALYMIHLSLQKYAPVPLCGISIKCY